MNTGFEGTYGLTIRSVAGAPQQANQTWDDRRPATRPAVAGTAHADNVSLRVTGDAW